MHEDPFVVLIQSGLSQGAKNLLLLGHGLGLVDLVERIPEQSVHVLEVDGQSVGDPEQALGRAGFGLGWS